ncbi:MAG: preprotein translocase subunit YajC [Candidatus Methanofastidiosia archaeon]
MEEELLSNVLFFVGFLLILWFLFIWPRRRHQKKAKEVLDNLKVGDRVITISGIHGTIKEIRTGTVFVEIADGVEVELLKTAIGFVKE